MTFTEPGTLSRIADVLDLLPNLTQDERAHIFHAIDTAPSAASWRYAKEIDLSHGSLLKPFTLTEACGWHAVPTFGQILAGLNRAVGVLS